MDFTLNDEQMLLRDMVSRYLRDQYDFDTRRARLKAGGEQDVSLWRDFAETLGILGASLPESVGGLGGGPIETMIVMEALGEALVTEPYLETVVLAGGLLRGAGGTAAHDLLAQIATGTARVAFAGAEATPRYAMQDARTRASRDGDGWVLDGAKSVVVGAPTADRLIVSAGTAGGEGSAAGISLFLVDPQAEGIELHAYRLVDERPAGDLVLRGLRVDGDALLGPEGAALPLIEQAIDEAIAALCAEAVGVMRRMLADTIEFAKERKQFGQPLAQFQVLQHRMVDMYMALERAVSATYLATLSLDGDPGARAKAVSAAKATIGETVRFVAQNAVQLHGAMGLTEELPVGHFFRRATVIEYQFGSVDHHVARYAALVRKAA
jgi:alkylation response protein AidB-like acyl-CoA dehydrogenase